jgi:N-formylglutamate amidohydrolase
MTTQHAPALAHAPLGTQEFERRLSTVYHPYHQTLAQELSNKRRRFGTVVLLSAHSMPSRSAAARGRPGRVHADLVTGTRGCSTAAREIVECVERVALARGLSVARDNPYPGGYTTRHHGRPGDGVQAVQVELSRALYMDEETLLPRSEGFQSTRMLCRELIVALGTLSLESSG